MKFYSKPKPFYLEFPIFQICYVLLWVPIGFTISFAFSYIFVKIFSFILVNVVHIFLPLAMDLFVMSGRMQLMEISYYVLISIVFDIMLLVLGLEFIISVLNKKKSESYGNEEVI